MRKGKDPDPPLSLKDPDPGGPKHAAPDPDPQLWVAVLQILIRRIRMFLGLPDPLVRGDGSG